MSQRRRFSFVAAAFVVLSWCWPASGIAAGVRPPSQAAKRARPSVSVPARDEPRAKATKRKPTYSASAARSRQARIRAARRARFVREAPIPRYKLDEQGDLIPDLRAAAAIIYNPETQQVLWEQNGQAQRSIASITKVMTAVAFLESQPDMSEVVTVARSDVYHASTTYLRANERISIDDLLHLLLIASDNAAARVLARISPWGYYGFIEQMNAKAKELGLTSTTYADPSGLFSENVSSAYDMARLIAYAGSDERIGGIMRMGDYTITTNRRKVTIHTTNALVRRSDVEVRGGKTGFIASSGYCLATLLRLPDLDQNVAVVVLGARSNTGRFLETRNLLSWLSTRAQDLFGRRDENPDREPAAASR